MKRNERVLIVDDELDFVEACQMTLSGKSYDVLTAVSKADAQDKVKSGVDIVVLGTLAPVGQAFALHHWLKHHPRYREIPLMVIDARREERLARGWIRVEGMQLEAEEYLTKPVEPAELAPRIKSLLQDAARVIKVIVADDHTMVRDGVCAVLGLQRDIDVVGEAVNGQDAIDKAVRLVPHVAVVDIVMPVLSGLEVTRKLCTACPQTRVLILTQYDEKENMAVARKAGAYGFIAKKAAGSDLVTGIRAVSGGSYYPSSFAEIGAN
jgi:DNA-binding NarL/FixJ family response regulator